jgi:hypothetical protein
VDEPALILDGIVLSPKKELVRVFYKEMWDHADKSLIPSIFHPDFTFRGSLGPSLVGHSQFAGYVDWVAQLLWSYVCGSLPSASVTLLESGRHS